MSGQLLMDEEFVAVFPSLIRRTGAAARAIVLQTIWFARDRATNKTVMTYDDIAVRTGLTKRTVERACAALREDGFLDRERLSIWDATSVWVVNQAALLDPADVAVSITPNGGIEDDKVADSHPANVAGSSSKNVEEELPSAPIVTDTDTFTEWWENYPRRRRQGKAECWSLWKKMTPEQRRLALVALNIDRYSPQWTKQDGEFVPGPARWLRTKRWLDDDVTAPVKAAAPTVNRSTPAPSAFDLVERADLAGLDYADAVALAERYLAATDHPTHEGFQQWRADQQ